jgi:2-oxo-4-hydroxy-4-carboxy--5-ureidoimidazoline (OHCU) decarboxylase
VSRWKRYVARHAGRHESGRSLSDLVRIYEAQMERDRLERLRVLPDLLAAESRRVAAEIERDQYAQRVDELTAEVAKLRTSLQWVPWVPMGTERP